MGALIYCEYLGVSFCFQLALFKIIYKLYLESTTVPHYAVLGSLFLNVTDWKRLEKGEVTCSACLSSKRDYSSLHDGLASGGSPVISLSPNNCTQHPSTFSHKIL